MKAGPFEVGRFPTRSGIEERQLTYNTGIYLQKYRCTVQCVNDSLVAHCRASAESLNVQMSIDQWKRKGSFRARPLAAASWRVRKVVSVSFLHVPHTSLDRLTSQTFAINVNAVAPLPSHDWVVRTFIDGRQIDSTIRTRTKFPYICQEIVFLEDGRKMQGQLTFTDLASYDLLHLLA